MNTTIAYFDQNAERCFADAFTITERTNQDHFLSYLRPGGTILDFGCGSGRDAAYFRAQGFEVVPTDGSREMCRLASEYLGIPVRVLEFNELDDEDRLAKTSERFPRLAVVEQGIFGNEHPGQPDFRWLYAYLRKR